MFFAILANFALILGSILTFGFCDSSFSGDLKMQRIIEFNKTITGKCTRPSFVNEKDTFSTGTTEECCEGYKPYEYDSSKCVPDCPNGCENGFCIQPDTCRCYPDHVRSHDNKCVPTCPISCLNGRCHSNGACSCKPNHVLDPSSRFCKPVCHQKCGYLKYCSAPGVCSCLPGYERDPSGDCRPVCRLNCLNGECIRPGVCACKHGFVLKAGVCQGNCTNCSNGKCVTDKVCSCDEGYTRDEKLNRCVPVCKGCSDGFCIAPDICECKKGYILINDVCKPDCNGECSNGYCVAPNTCNCKDGFSRSIFGQCKRLYCYQTDNVKTDCTIAHLG